jgi:hypothetical protein
MRLCYLGNGMPRDDRSRSGAARPALQICRGIKSDANCGLITGLAKPHHCVGLLLVNWLTHLRP